MKKLLLLVALQALCFVAVAGGPTYRLKNGTYNELFPILAPTDIVDGNRMFESYYNLNYKVTDSQNRVFGDYTHTAYDIAHVSFSSNDDVNIALWHDIDGKATKGEAHVDLSLRISDYGIYFLDEDQNGLHTYYSLATKGISVEAGREFGVYYEGTDTLHNTTGIYTTTDNWVASFDGPRANNHVDGTDVTESSFFCLFQGIYGNFPAELEWDHVEFGFKKASDLSGQPLPGLLTTLGLGGVLVAGISKKRKLRLKK